MPPPGRLAADEGEPESEDEPELVRLAVSFGGLRVAGVERRNRSGHREVDLVVSADDYPLPARGLAAGAAAAPSSGARGRDSHQRDAEWELPTPEDSLSPEARALADSQPGVDAARRIRRAWYLGRLGALRLAGHPGPLPRAPPGGLQPHRYAVLRGRPGDRAAAVLLTYAEFLGKAGNFGRQGGWSFADGVICQGFHSVPECQAYFLGANVPYPQ
jgi:hypothetical protein